MNVAVIGASDKPHRYAYRAVSQLLKAGHTVFPVHPVLKETQGLLCFKSVRDIPHPVHTITLYINAERSEQIANELLAVHPERIIFNPGSENSELTRQARDQGITTLEACTLVLLSTNQFS